MGYTNGSFGRDSQVNACPLNFNTMADYASRSFDLTPNDSNLFQFCSPSALCLDRMHPQIRNDFLSNLGIVQEAIKSGVGTSRTTKTDCGWNSLTHTKSTSGSRPTQTHYHTSKYLNNASETADFPPTTNPYDLAQLSTPSEWQDKHTNNWEPKT
jgi:hypothetical protein